MSVTLTGTGGLFTRLGKIGLLFNTVNGQMGSAAPSIASAWGSSGPTISELHSAINAIEAQYASTRQDLVDALYSQRDSYRTSAATLKTYLRTLAQNTLIGMFDDDLKLAQGKKTVTGAAEALIAQMKTATTTYLTAPTVSATSTAWSANNGDGVCAVSVIGSDGVTLVSPFAETIDVTCTSDSQVSSALLSVETFAGAGDTAQSDALAWDWPLGSAASVALTAVNANNTSSNLLSNGDFETFTVANVPDGFTVATGAAGTDIFSEGTTVYGNAKALKLLGTGGSPLSELYQALTTLKANTVYAGCVWVRDSGAGLLAGVVQLDLHNGSAVINDDAGTANSTTRSFAQTTATYAAHTFFFRTPRVLPTTVRFRIKVTTALTSGESIYIDRLALAEATQAYAGGPYLKVFSGATKFVRNDTFAVAVSNDFAGRWCKVLERLLGLRALGLQLPVSGTTNINDNLLL